MSFKRLLGSVSGAASSREEQWGESELGHAGGLWPSSDSPHCSSRLLAAPETDPKSLLKLMRGLERGELLF